MKLGKNSVNWIEAIWEIIFFPRETNSAVSFTPTVISTLLVMIGIWVLVELIICFFFTPESNRQKWAILHSACLVGLIFSFVLESYFAIEFFFWVLIAVPLMLCAVRPGWNKNGTKKQLYNRIPLLVLSAVDIVWMVIGLLHCEYRYQGIYSWYISAPALGDVSHYQLHTLMLIINAVVTALCIMYSLFNKWVHKER